MGHYYLLEYKVNDKYHIINRKEIEVNKEQKEDLTHSNILSANINDEVNDKYHIINRKDKEFNKEQILKEDLTHSNIISANINDEVFPNSYKGIKDKLMCDDNLTAKTLKLILRKK